MSLVTEIAPEIFRICTYVPEANLQFHQFLVRDEEPLLWHAGLRHLFPAIREAVATLIAPADLRWVGGSHFEADEFGALNDWLETAPRAEPICSVTAAILSVNDLAARPARAFDDGDTFSTGAHRFRFLRTPHVPHGWDAGHLFEETSATLLCSDLLHQGGEVETFVGEEVVERMRAMFLSYTGGPLDLYMPYTHYTDGTLRRLAALQPRTCATMHGGTYQGDGERILLAMADMMREVLGPPPA